MTSIHHLQPFVKYFIKKSKISSIFIHVEDESPFGRHLREPKVKMFESKNDTDLNIKLKKVIKRLKSHSEPGTERIEVLKLDEAEIFEFIIAHQVTPFYYNAKENNAAQLKKWCKPVCERVFRKENRDDRK